MGSTNVSSQASISLTRTDPDFTHSSTPPIMVRRRSRTLAESEAQNPRPVSAHLDEEWVNRQRRESTSGRERPLSLTDADLRRQTKKETKVKASHHNEDTLADLPDRPTRSNRLALAESGSQRTAPRANLTLGHRRHHSALDSGPTSAPLPPQNGHRGFFSRTGGPINHGINGVSSSGGGDGNENDWSHQDRENSPRGVEEGNGAGSRRASPALTPSKVPFSAAVSAALARARQRASAVVSNSKRNSVDASSLASPRSLTGESGLRLQLDQSRTLPGRYEKPRIERIASPLSPARMSLASPTATSMMNEINNRDYDHHTSRQRTDSMSSTQTASTNVSRYSYTGYGTEGQRRTTTSSSATSPLSSDRHHLTGSHVVDQFSTHQDRRSLALMDDDFDKPEKKESPTVGASSVEVNRADLLARARSRTSVNHVSQNDNDAAEWDIVSNYDATNEGRVDRGGRHLLGRHRRRPSSPLDNKYLSADDLVTTEDEKEGMRSLHSSLARSTTISSPAHGRTERANRLDAMRRELAVLDTAAAQERHNRLDSLISPRYAPTHRLDAPDRVPSRERRYRESSAPVGDTQRNERSGVMPRASPVGKSRALSKVEPRASPDLSRNVHSSSSNHSQTTMTRIRDQYTTSGSRRNGSDHGYDSNSSVDDVLNNVEKGGRGGDHDGGDRVSRQHRSSPRDIRRDAYALDTAARASPRLAHRTAAAAGLTDKKPVRSHARSQSEYIPNEQLSVRQRRMGHPSTLRIGRFNDGDDGDDDTDDVLSDRTVRNASEADIPSREEPRTPVANQRYRHSSLADNPTTPRSSQFGQSSTSTVYRLAHSQADSSSTLPLTRSRQSTASPDMAKRLLRATGTPERNGSIRGMGGGIETRAQQLLLRAQDGFHSIMSKAAENDNSNSPADTYDGPLTGTRPLLAAAGLDIRMEEVVTSAVRLDRALRQAAIDREQNDAIRAAAGIGELWRDSEQIVRGLTEVLLGLTAPPKEVVPARRLGASRAPRPLSHRMTNGINGNDDGSSASSSSNGDKLARPDTYGFRHRDYALNIQDPRAFEDGDSSPTRADAFSRTATPSRSPYTRSLESPVGNETYPALSPTQSFSNHLNTFGGGNSNGVVATAVARNYNRRSTSRTSSVASGASDRATPSETVSRSHTYATRRS